MEINHPDGGFERALASVPSCALDADDRRAQQARYGAVANSVTAVRRERRVVFVDFGERVDPADLEEIVAVERVCCPWLRFEFDGAARRLAVTVADSAMLPALDAIEDAFKGAVQ